MDGALDGAGPVCLANLGGRLGFAVNVIRDTIGSQSFIRNHKTWSVSSEMKLSHYLHVTFPSFNYRFWNINMSAGNYSQAATSCELVYIELDSLNDKRTSIARHDSESILNELHLRRSANCLPYTRKQLDTSTTKIQLILMSIRAQFRS